MARRTLAAAIGIMAVAVAASTASATPRLATGSSTPIGPGSAGAGGPVTSGPDGNVWFGFIGYGSPGGGIRAMSTTGIITANYPMPAALFPLPYQDPSALTPGPDGRLWFMQGSGPGVAGPVGAVTTAGQYSMFPTPAGTVPGGLTAGPDGNMWAGGGGAVLRVTTAGSVTALSVPAGITNVGAVAFGADGALWFSAAQGETAVLGRMTLAGQVTTQAVPRPTGTPAGWTPFVTALGVGPDGTVWATVGTVSEDSPTNGPGSVLSLRQGGITTIARLSWLSCPLACTLVTGADGNAWFANGNGVTRVTPTGVVRNFPVVASHNGGAEPSGLAVGPDRNLWFNNSVDGTLWTLAMSAGAPVAVPARSRMNGLAFDRVTRGKKLPVQFLAGASASGRASVTITRAGTTARLWRGTIKPGSTYSVSGRVPSAFPRGMATVRLVTSSKAGSASTRVSVR